jgi:hypothetical protein
MAIDTYTSLKAAIERWTHRSDLDSYLDDFIDITESRLNRELQVSQQETRVTLSASSEYISFPTDSISIRAIQLNSSPVRELQYITPIEMDRLDDNSTDLNYYTIEGNQIRLQSVSSDSIEVIYYAKISALSDTNTSNWVLETHPEAYLYGAVSEAFKYSQDDEQASKYVAMFNEVISRIKVLDADRKFTQSLWVRVA